ncbi:MAG TPA: response regulator [Candidatus Obscuribacterales bacterium]
MHDQWGQKEIKDIKGQIAALKRSLDQGRRATSDQEGLIEHKLGNVHKQIDELVSSEERLKERILLLQSVIDSISLGLLAVDQDGLVILANAAATGILGEFQPQVPQDEWPLRHGCFLADGITPYPAESFPLLQAMAGSETGEVEMFVRNRLNPDGIWISMNAWPMKEKTGQKRGAVAVLRTVSQWTQPELAHQVDELASRIQEFAATNEELKSLADTLVRARDEALQSSRLKSEFLANMSHEIRTPLNAVISMSDLLVQTELSQEQSELAEIIRSSGRALLDIINDILDFSKIEAGKVCLEIEDFELVSVVEDTAELVAEKARQKRLSLMSFVSPELPCLLRGDPGRLRQILLNLADNAVKFTEQGHVMVSASLQFKKGSTVVVRFAVTDTGIGIPEDSIARLFQPFTQADGSVTRKYGGTGLGLSIAKSLVELMGGEIGLQSKRGIGTTFWFTVPLEAVPAVEPVPSADLGEARILLVGSPPTGSEIIREYCRSWRISCDVAGTAREALTQLSRMAATGKPYHIAIIERDTPDANGFDIGQQIHCHPGLSDTRTILMSSYLEKGDGEKALRSGFSAYLTRPVRQSRLFNCIANIMGKSSGPAADKAAVIPAPEAPTRTRLVLVAEDNQVNQKVAALLLKDLGFVAHIVANGREAVEAASRTRYALILMDCQMPEMDGYEATRLIRKAESLTGVHTPIIALTAHAVEGDREKCLTAGMDDYVSKPVSKAKLKESLERWAPPE